MDSYNQDFYDNQYYDEYEDAYYNAISEEEDEEYNSENEDHDEDYELEYDEDHESYYDKSKDDEDNYMKGYASDPAYDKEDDYKSGSKYPSHCKPKHKKPRHNPCRVFRGWTVKEIFEQAQSALGGCCDSYNHRSATCDIRRLNRCVAFINHSFRGGKYRKDEKSNIFTDKKKCESRPSSKCKICKDNNRCTADLMIYDKCVHSYHLGGCIKAIATMEYSQETYKPKDAIGSGNGIFYIDPVGYKMYYDVVYRKLSSKFVSGHIHGYAPRGQDAPVIYNVTFVGDGDYGRAKGYWEFPANYMGDIMKGLAYVNVRSATNGQGELRGQIEIV